MASATVAQLRTHRKAYGSHRTMSAAYRAQSIAMSIIQRVMDGRAWTWAEYGIDTKPDMIVLVSQQLEQSKVLDAFGAMNGSSTDQRDL